MMQQLMTKNRFWAVVLVIVVAMLVYGNQLPTSLGILGLPIWIWYFLAIHILFFIALAFYSRKVKQ